MKCDTHDWDGEDVCPACKVQASVRERMKVQQKPQQQTLPPVPEIPPLATKTMIDIIVKQANKAIEGLDTRIKKIESGAEGNQKLAIASNVIQGVALLTQAYTMFVELKEKSKK